MKRERRLARQARANTAAGEGEEETLLLKDDQMSEKETGEAFEIGIVEIDDDVEPFENGEHS